MNQDFNTRREFIARGAMLGILAFPAPSLSFFGQKRPGRATAVGYPAIDDEVVAEVVGKSHFDLDRVKQLVDPRPELARATWDWGFGDFETALGAASHVGRRDIAQFLMEKGARADLFTFATLGEFDVVKAAVKASPGIQAVGGPHGFSLLHHAEAGLEMTEGLTQRQLDDSNRLIDFLKGLGNAGSQERYLEVDEVERAKYLGDYRYGDGEKEGFSVRLNRRKMLTLGIIGQFGGALYKLGENSFTYNGAPSVDISFTLENGAVQALTVREPGFALTAKKVT